MYSDILKRLIFIELFCRRLKKFQYQIFNWNVLVAIFCWWFFIKNNRKYFLFKTVVKLFIYEGEHSANSKGKKSKTEEKQWQGE